MAYITYTKGEERMIFEVIAYEDVNGKIPVQDFLFRKILLKSF